MTVGEESLQKTKRMRVCSLTETLKTEQDYVNKLNFIVHTFMERLQSRENNETDQLVPTGTTETLLSNVEELLQFNTKLLARMETCFADKGKPKYEDTIGHAFVQFENDFEVYAPYCSNHERAQKKLADMTQVPELQSFIVGCLLLGNYINEQSMEGFLLSPIQRLCKYPLLLREILKHTPADHPDHKDVSSAFTIMTNVCQTVNETKRQLEQLEGLEDLQNTIANWEGTKLTDTCTKLLKEGSLLKISAGNIQERQFFLFDHLLVYASKRSSSLPRRKSARTKSQAGSLSNRLPNNDSSKTSTLQRKKVKRKKSVADAKKWLFKGRISTDLMEIENLEDGASDFHCGGYTVKNGWKVLNAAKNKWFVLIAKDNTQKEEWLNEFIKEREQRRKSQRNTDQRDTIDVMHNRGKKIYYRALHKGVIKDNKSRMRTFTKSMFGSEFVEFLVANNEAKNNDEAVLLGQALLDCGIIHHVTDKYHFKNENVLFRFRYDDGTFKPRGETQDLIARGIRVFNRLHCLFDPLIKEKDSRLTRTYRYVIESKKLIDWMVDNNDCRSREEASNLGQSMCEVGILHHALDKQDFKDDTQLFKFLPDEDAGEWTKLRDLVKKSSSKHDFRLSNSLKTKTLLLLNGDDESALGFEARHNGEHVIVHKIECGKQAQLQGMTVNQEIIMINNCSLTNVDTQSRLDSIIDFNRKKYKLIHVTVRAEDEQKIQIPVTREGMGFQIRGSNPCVVHSVSLGGMAMNSGLVKGHAILKILNGEEIQANFPPQFDAVFTAVNGKFVSKDSHDDVASTIREGCRVVSPAKPLTSDDSHDSHSGETESSEAEESESGSITSTNSSSESKKSGGKSQTNKRKTLALRIGINHTSLHHGKDKKDQEEASSKNKPQFPTLDLVVGNRHLERTCMYTFDNGNGIRQQVVERMSESASIFDLAAQLLEVLVAEDERVLSDLKALEDVATSISENVREVYERRRTLRANVISKRLEDYQRYKRHLAAYMWPSYKQARDRVVDPSAKDFCPTNCHVNLMQVSHTKDQSYNVKGLGNKSSANNASAALEEKQEELMHTCYGVTCMSAPSFRTRGRQHGLMAVLRGVESNSELMDAIRQLMVALDHAVIELKKGQTHLNSILSSESKRFSMSSVRSEDCMSPTSPQSSQQFASGSSASGKRTSNTSLGMIFGGMTSPSQSGRNSMASHHNDSVIMDPDDEPTTPLHDSMNGGDQDPNSVVTTPTATNNNTTTTTTTDGQQVGTKDHDGANGGGNESECDSGIHSNRCSMVGSDGTSSSTASTAPANKPHSLFFNFPNNSSQNDSIPEGGSSQKTTVNTVDTNSMRRSALLINTGGTGADGAGGSEAIQMYMKSSSSMPSLTDHRERSQNGGSERSLSPVKLRNAKKNSRPTSRVTFSSSHDRVSLISTTGSTCSSDGTDINFLELTLSPDALDKLQGTLDHFQRKLHSLSDLVHSPTVKSVFELTKDTTPDRSYQSMIDKIDASTSVESLKLSLSSCDSTEKFSDVLKTLMDSVDGHVREVRTQLVLCVLLHEDPTLVSRRDKVFSQSLASAISSFSTQLRSALCDTYNNMTPYGTRSEQASRKWLEQCMSIGVFVLFQTMLNPNDPIEGTMLEDSYVGVYDLERVSFHFRAITGNIEANESPTNVNLHTPTHVDVNGVGYSMEGNRCALKIFFHLDKHIFIKLPPRLQAGGGVKLLPALINHGLENLGETLYEQGVSMQAFVNKINERAHSQMYDYYKRFRAFHLDRSKLPRDNDARAVLIDRLARPLNALDEINTLIEANIRQKNGRDLSAAGCGVIPLASEFCFRIGGCHVIGCSNGVQRSSIACAIQQSTILAICHGLPPKHLSSAQTQMIRVGSRQYATLKNEESRDTMMKNVPRLFSKFHADN